MEKKLITFDAYSALFDIEGSIIPVVEDVLGSTLNEKCIDFFRFWRKKQWDFVLLSNSLNKGHLSYFYITEKTLIYTAKKYDVELTDKMKEVLRDSWKRLNTWPEANCVLSQLKEKGYELAILSNGDTDMLEALTERLDTKIDYIFSAEKAGAYKPNPKIYLLPLDSTDYNHDNIIHVAGSPFDTLGARAVGMNCIWSNRFSDYLIEPKYSPTHEVSNLFEILQYL